ncbi:hypothetical protein DFR30_2438 [Thiogranum longum]|uniref:Type IV pilus assembly protein PilV n=1 Tax=Thiogranum longum TaxID=1537524 RepID=A0A4R1HPD6_9GAMM|nr:hypothetical protein [Thiogranum longum]TCK19142.1 hypothetical protein DFR30_2438 [Thiogranum longum]
MHHRQTGFSLTEALISLLVLSIGWLGLGQLQARLSIASQNQASTAYARLIQSDLYEKIMSYELSDIPGSAPGIDPVSTPSGTYTIQLSRSSADRLSTTDITVAWVDLDTARNTIISSTLSSYPTPFDTRWLLTPP